MNDRDFLFPFDFLKHEIDIYLFWEIADHILGMKKSYPPGPSLIFGYY